MTSSVDRLRRIGESLGCTELIFSVETPLRVTHELSVQVWFSVKGEDAQGQPCPEAATALRVLVLSKNTILPNVSLNKSMASDDSAILSQNSWVFRNASRPIHR